MPNKTPRKSYGKPVAFRLSDVDYANLLTAQRRRKIRTRSALLKMIVAAWLLREQEGKNDQEES